MPAARPRLRFPRDAHIRRGGEFARVRAGGRRLVSGCLIVNWMALTAPARSRLGVITSRKVGNSVVRSRTRRLMREVYRLHQHDLAGPVALVLVARASMATAPFAQVERDYLRALQRGGLTAGLAPESAGAVSA